MSRATLIVAVRASLDIDAARRLAPAGTSYATLDDAGVTRAVEQIHTQRWGRWDLPAHLARIDTLTLVRVLAGEVTLHHLTRETCTGEADLLAACAAIAPDTPFDLVDWDGHDSDTLIARFVACDRPMPRALADARAARLAGWLAPTAADHPAPDREFETACRQLFASNDSHDAIASQDDTRAIAVDRAVLWWRVQTTRGRLHPRRRAALTARLRALDIR